MAADFPFCGFWEMPNPPAQSSVNPRGMYVLPLPCVSEALPPRSRWRGDGHPTGLCRGRATHPTPQAMSAVLSHVHPTPSASPDLFTDFHGTHLYPGKQTEFLLPQSPS